MPEIIVPFTVIGLTAYVVWRYFPRDLFRGPRWPRTQLTMNPAKVAGLFVVAGVLFIAGGLMNSRSVFVAVGATFFVLGLALRKARR